MTQKLCVSVLRKDILTFKQTFALLDTFIACFSELFDYFIHTEGPTKLQPRGIKAFGGINADKHELVISGDMNQ